MHNVKGKGLACNNGTARHGTAREEGAGREGAAALTAVLLVQRVSGGGAGKGTGRGGRHLTF